MNIGKSEVTDSLIDDIIEEVKARMDRMQEETCGCSRNRKSSGTLGRLSRQKENILRFLCRDSNSSGSRDI